MRTETDLISPCFPEAWIEVIHADLVTFTGEILNGKLSFFVQCNH